MFERFSEPVPLDGEACKEAWHTCDLEKRVQTNTLEFTDLTLSIGKLCVTQTHRVALHQLQSQAARDLLRHSLRSRHPSLDQTAWVISSSGAGRPEVTGPISVDASLSHRACWVATAWSAQFKVGIDIEVMDAPLRPQTWDLFLHPQEIDWLSTYDANTASVQALALWCRKEAWLKACAAAGQIAMPAIVFSRTGQLLSVNGDRPNGTWHFRLWQIQTQALFAVAYGHS